MLSNYQQKLFNDFRAQVRDEEIDLVTVVSSGSGNSYGEGVTRTESTQTLLGKVGWNPIFEKNETQGGYEEIGDCSILFDYEDMDKVDVENVYLKTASGGDLAIIKITPAEMSGECLVICKKK